jgi:hypothetical protein
MVHFHSQKSSTVTMNGLNLTQFASVSGRRMWRSGSVVECKPEKLGSLLGGVTFVTIQLCRRSSTFVKNLNKFDGYHLRSSTLALHL